MTDQPDLIVTTEGYGMDRVQARSNIGTALAELKDRNRRCVHDGIDCWPGGRDYIVRVGPLNEIQRDPQLLGEVATLARLCRKAGIRVELLNHEHPRNPFALEHIGSAVLRDMAAIYMDTSDPAVTYREAPRDQLEAWLQH